MITSSTINTAADLAAVLVSQGVTLSAKGGTPLAKLNQTLMGPGLGELTGVVAADKDDLQQMDPGWTAMMVEYSRVNAPGGEPTEYQGYMTLLAEEIALSVSGTIDFARNVVNPIIKEVCDNISNALDEAGKGGSYAANDRGVRFALSNGSLVINILEEGPDALYLDSVTESESNARLSTPYQNTRAPVMFPQMTSVELMEYMEANAKTEFQRDVINQLKGEEDGYDRLHMTYSNTYAFIPGKVSSTDIASLRNDMSLHPLLVLAIGLTLIEELPENTTGSATNIQSALGAWITQVKNIIAINIDVYKQALSNKSIVLNSFTDNFETTVVVNKENYRSYLEDGGSTEALLGATFTDRNYDYDNLLTRQVEYEEDYQRRMAEAAAYNTANRLAIFKNKLREEIYNQIFNCDEDAIRPVAPSEARQALDALLKKVYINALDCPHETVRSVVCNTLFLGTDAEEILVNIDALCTKNENLSVRDAGALVTINYLAKFLTSQMDVKRLVP